MNMTELNELLNFDRKHLWHPYASMTNPPPVNFAVSAQGTRIKLASGQELLDSISSWWCVCHGHSQPKIMNAIREQTGKIAEVMFAGFTHEPAVRLAQKLTAHTPAGLNRVFYADSGSVSVECAAKLAVQYQLASGHSSRLRLATVRGGYHGDTTGAMALSDPEGMHQMFSGILPKHFFAPRPEIPFGGKWDEADFLPMKTMLEEHSDEIAGVILEPVFQGANGMRFYHPDYLKSLRKTCDELGLVLILDEIATGFGRTGKFFALEYAGIVPDIMCVGKGLTGGAITLAAVVASEKVAETVSAGKPGVFLHGPTFMANPVACAAGCASLELFDEYDWQGRVTAIQDQMRSELGCLKEHPAVNDVRVLGAVGVVELKHLPSPEVVQKTVLETGVWMRPFGSWLYAMPPFVTSPEELSRITEAMKLLTGRCPAE